MVCGAGVKSACAQVGRHQKPVPGKTLKSGSTKEEVEVAEVRVQEEGVKEPVASEP